MDRGLTPRRVALILYGVCGLAAGFSLLQQVAQMYYGGLIVILFCAAAWIGIQHLGYLEFGVAGRMLVGGAFRRMLNSQLALRDFLEALAAAATPEACWRAIRDAARGFGFSEVELHLAGKDYFERLVDGGLRHTWTMTIPLSEEDSATLALEFGAETQPSMVAPFAAAMRNAMAPKIELFRNAAIVFTRTAEAGTAGRELPHPRSAEALRRLRGVRR